MRGPKLASAQGGLGIAWAALGEMRIETFRGGTPDGGGAWADGDLFAAFDALVIDRLVFLLLLQSFEPIVA